MSAPLLTARELVKRFPGGTTAVDGVGLDLAPGEVLGVVGESGCGKSTLLRLLNGLHRADAGSVRFRNTEVVGASGPTLRELRRQVQMIFQDPAASLNPRMRVEALIEEPMRIHGLERKERGRRIRDMLDAVQLPASSLRKFPHEFSGGQRQRIGIARALVLRPQLVLADEPVASLDVSIQAQILSLLQSLREEFGCAMVFVAHDLPVVQGISDRMAVMQRGRVIETLPSRDFFTRAQDPFTRRLIAAVADAGPGSA